MLWQPSSVQRASGSRQSCTLRKTKCLNFTPDSLHKMEITATMCGIGEVEGGGLNNC